MKNARFYNYTMAQEYQHPIQNENTYRADGGIDESAKVDRIRDILFGELRELLLQQYKILGGEIKDKYNQMKAGLDHETAQIRSGMIAREALAEMLSEVALRLKNEFRLSGL